MTRPRPLTLALTALLVVAMAGCGGPLSRTVRTQDLAQRGVFDVIPGLDIPEVRGVDGCGAQALAAVLAHDDDAIDTAALAEELPWHDVGATPVDLLLEARQRGHAARIERGTWSALEQTTRAEQPAIVMLDVHDRIGWIPLPKMMHWSVVSGMARDGETILLGATQGRHHPVPRDAFLERWAIADNCLILVTPVR